MSAEKRDHKHHDGSSTRAFTAEQKAAVIRVRRCKATEFYDILGLEEVKVTCSDGEIKKAYRKLSLLTHPDKNGYDGADEAFKMVSRAFQVLSDPDKKTKFDRYGGDPDSRFGAGSSASGASPFSGFASQRGGTRQGDMFGEEISPEELFRQFFGGGLGGQPFGGPFGFGGQGFVFNMGGGPGIRVQQMGGGFPRARPHNHPNANAPTSTFAAIQGLLPIILVVLITIFSSLFADSGPTYPAFKWDAQPPQTQLHTSGRLKVPYYVNPVEVQDYTARKWRELDQVAESRYVHHLDAECQWEQNQRQRLFQEAQGIFWRRNEEKWEAAKQYQMPSCQKLESWGYRLHR